MMTTTITNSEHIVLAAVTELISAISSLPIPRPLFADLHVHSDDTVGTNDTTYNFAYGQQVAGLDIIGYTANDFNITKAKWDATLDLIKQNQRVIQLQGPWHTITPLR